MELTLRAATPAERKYAYNQSHQIAMQCGGIYYLKGQFGRNGQELLGTGYDICRIHRPEDFITEFGKTFDALETSEQFGSLLKTADAMEAYCRKNSSAGFQGDAAREYAFRADTEKHTYLIRYLPSTFEKDIYIFVYASKHLDRHMERAEQGIRFVDVNGKPLFHLVDGESITITHRDTEQVTRVCRFIDTYHVEIGSHLYHIDEFASKMQQAGSRCQPAEIKRDKTNRGGR
jgi:hypothetical protein